MVSETASIELTKFFTLGLGVFVFHKTNITGIARQLRQFALIEADSSLGFRFRVLRYVAI